MALSNITREPQREITESVVGFALFGGFTSLDWWIASKLHIEGSTSPVADFWLFFIVGVPLCLVLAVLGTIGLVFFTHFLGKVACDLLRALRLDPRPKLRRHDRTDYRTGERITEWR